MSTLTVVDLKEKLKEMNLPTTGSKSELIKRLLEAGVPPEELRVISQVKYEKRRLMKNLNREQMHN